MQNAAWREEKSETIVQVICDLLASSETPPAVKEQLSNPLYNALKLFADALEERLGSGKTKWSPGVVDLFRNQPSRCKEWLELMAEPEFSAESYWGEGKDGGFDIHTF